MLFRATYSEGISQEGLGASQVLEQIHSAHTTLKCFSSSGSQCLPNTLRNDPSCQYQMQTRSHAPSLLKAKSKSSMLHLQAMHSSKLATDQERSGGKKN